MSMLIDSANPVIITADGVEKTYDKWMITVCGVSIINGTVPISVYLQRCGVIDGVLETCPIGKAEYTVLDSLTDSDLSASSNAFFTALVTKMLTQGVIS